MSSYLVLFAIVVILFATRGLVKAIRHRGESYYYCEEKFKPKLVWWMLIHYSVRIMMFVLCCYYKLHDFILESKESSSIQMRSFKSILKAGQFLQICNIDHFRQPFMGIILVVNEEYETNHILLSKSSLIEIKNEKVINSTRRILFYVHGGGFLGGDFGGFKSIVYNLCDILHCSKAMFPHYRLTPEYTLEDQIVDVIEAYEFMVSQCRGEGYDFEIIAAGDSAGGTILLQTLQRMCEDENKDNYVQPITTILFSPITCIKMSGKSVETNRYSDVLLTYKGLSWGCSSALNSVECGIKYSPLYNKEMNKLPPLFISVAKTEMLLDDSIQMAENARKQNVYVNIDIINDSFHAYPCFSNLVPEGKQLLRRVKQHVDLVRNEGLMRSG